MKHRSSRIVFDHWNDRRRSRAAPERADIDPGAIRHALGDTFMLAEDFAGQLRFRLAGTRVCALFCRELKGETFGPLFSGESRKEIDPLLAIICEERAGAVAGVIGNTADGAADLEMLLLPLESRGHARIRMLGVLAPMIAPYWLGEKPVTELTLRTLRHLTTQPSKPCFLPPQKRRSPPRFVVYSGGRDEERAG